MELLWRFHSQFLAELHQSVEILFVERDAFAEPLGGQPPFGIAGQDDFVAAVERAGRI